MLLKHCQKTVAPPDLRPYPLAFHFSGPDYHDTGHVDMWAPYLHRAQVPWFVICREENHYASLNARGITAIFAPKAADLRRLVPSHLRAVLYANNGHRNRDMIAAFPDATHVQMLHGDSDKPPSYSLLTKSFDQVWVAGQMAIARYAAHGVMIPLDRFRIIGRPQAENLLRGPRMRAREALTIGYMPTWLGYSQTTRFSSLELAPHIIAALGQITPRPHILFKAHPLSTQSATMRPIVKAIAAAGGDMIAPHTPAADIYNRADVLLTDLSSTMTDYLYTGRPQIVTVPQGVDIADFPSARAAYHLRGAADIAAIMAQISTDDPLQTARIALREQLYGAGLDGPPDAPFIAAVRALVGAP
ncbi:CDP-glycerol glycerophosphotransferase family protein [Ketogulonicigenium vulgare]|uniref:CDP-glycerol glycerophosphotransferase family protein n=1 Tax=Ketogulonicigenium vulgare TaxID=92945 RepID=UPI002359F31A|nr:CDP-glycerol glycerophosphotransferase family protein [Ketogulonicigenium vulgare]